MNAHAQPATIADPHARRSDPPSSHRAVTAIAADATLMSHILHAARRLAPAAFDDTDLLELIEEQTGRRQQRNVIARSRGLLVGAGQLIGIGVRERHNRATLHFRLPRAGEQLSLPEQTKPCPEPELVRQYKELPGWTFCKIHGTVNKGAGGLGCTWWWSQDDQITGTTEPACRFGPIYILE